MDKEGTQTNRLKAKEIDGFYTSNNKDYMSRKKEEDHAPALKSV